MCPGNTTAISRRLRLHSQPPTSPFQFLLPLFLSYASYVKPACPKELLTLENYPSVTSMCSVVSNSESLWTVAYQAPPSMGFSRPEYWSGLPFPCPGDVPDPGIERTRVSRIIGRCFTIRATGDSMCFYSFLNFQPLLYWFFHDSSEHNQVNIYVFKISINPMKSIGGKLVTSRPPCICRGSCFFQAPLSLSPQPVLSVGGLWGGVGVGT